MAKRTGVGRSIAHMRLSGLVLLLAAVGATAQTARPYPRKESPPAQDIGAMALERNHALLSATVVLKRRNDDQLQALATALHTPGDPQFHRFLSAAEFHARFDPAASVVAEANAHLQQSGLSVMLENGNLLRVSGSAEAMQRAFGAPVHVYEVASRGNVAGYRFHAPTDEPRIASTTVAPHVEAILGLDEQPHFRPHLHRKASFARDQAAEPRSTAVGNPPGGWTVTDLAQYYNIQPLYDRGVHGEGQTMAIVTLAAFTPSDAYTYWGSLGLPVKADRLKVVDIDGGPGAPSDDSGSDETTLDVQQAGGVAPAAKIVLYQSPNTDQAFFDAFVRAVNDNVAQTISTSWGDWELLNTQTRVGVGKGRSVILLNALGSVFLQAAVQGQSVFAASGDAGAYDGSDSFPLPDFSKILSVDSPASSAWITAAGGTTLAGSQVFNLKDGSVYTVDVPVERVWGWDYLNGLCAKLGLDPISCGIFPVGSGGGVSAFVPLPFYQTLVSTRTTEPAQALYDKTTQPKTLLATLPSHFRGRNLPDVSLNADPETGYLIDYTSDVSGYGQSYYNGGTSFVSPQLNGIAALLGQRLHTRLGLLNIPLYLMAATPLGYTGPHAPLRDIVAGSNGFYAGAPGYDLGSGVGTLDVANFARALHLLGY